MEKLSSLQNYKNKESLLKRNTRRIRQLMNTDEIKHALEEMAIRICRLVPNPEHLVIMGMATRGIPIAERLSLLVQEKYGKTVPVGSLDATFYRDDFHYRLGFSNPKMQITHIPQSIEGKNVVLIDDVLFTGRTIRAALNAIMDLGRAHTIRLGVLVDRGHRQLPIAPDFTGIKVETRQNEEVLVSLQPIDDEDSVWLVELEGNICQD